MELAQCPFVLQDGIKKCVGWRFSSECKGELLWAGQCVLNARLSAQRRGGTAFELRRAQHRDHSLPGAALMPTPRPRPALGNTGHTEDQAPAQEPGWTRPGLPWGSSNQDSALPVQQAQAQPPCWRSINKPPHPAPGSSGPRAREEPAGAY